MINWINKYKILILGLEYISIIKALPFNDNVNPQTQQDCQTLLEIYQHFNLNLPPFANDENKNCCDYQARLAASNGQYPTTDWICDSSNTRINSIILKERNISTDIPWDLFNRLDNLEVLHLFNNQLNGEIKGDLRGVFPNLKQLRLQNNNLSGYLPTYLPPNIETFIVDGNDQINDSIPSEWNDVGSMRDCILPNNICTPRNSPVQCYSATDKNYQTPQCQDDAQEDRSGALQQLNNSNIEYSNDNISNDMNNNMNNDMNNNDNNMNNDNNNMNMDNNNNMDNNMDNNNMNVDNNNNNNDPNNENNNQPNNNTSNNTIGLNNKKKKNSNKKRSYAVLIMTLSIISLLIFILILVCLVSHFSRKKTREKEKDIYSGKTIFDDNPNNNRTEASIFYSKTNNTNSPNHIMTFDENNNNSISIFNAISHNNTLNSQNNKLLNSPNKLIHSPSPLSPKSNELSFIENPNPENMNMNNDDLSFSDIDASDEIIEPQPAFVASPNTSMYK